MDYRSVGTSALRSLDSDPAGHTLPAACLLRAGAAQHTPAEGPAGSALLAYLPGTDAGMARGALLALTTAATEARAVLTTAEFVRAYHASLGRRADQALQSAIVGTLRHMGALTHTAGAPDLAFAYAAIQDRQVWIAGRGAVAAHVLRVARGQWEPLAARQATRPTPLAPTFFAPVTLETGDVLLLLSRSVQLRLTKRLIRRCLLGLIQDRPRVQAQNLADTLVRMAAVDGGTEPLAALVVRCHAVLAPEAARAYHWPAAYGAALRLPAEADWHLPAPDALTAHPVPPSTVADHTPVRLQTADSGVRSAATLPEEAATEATPDPAPPPAAPQSESSAPPPPSPAAPPPPAMPRPTLRLPHPALALAVAVGLGLGWLSGTFYYLLSLASVAGIIGLLAFWWRSFGRSQAGPGRAAPPADGSAAGARRRLQTVSRATARPLPEPFTLPPSGAAGEPRQLLPSKARLALPLDRALQPGCLDIVSLRDGNGRIVAQVVLLGPDHLLTHPSEGPDGLYVVLHDLVEDRRSAVAWLAPGRARALEAATAQALTAYSGAAGPVLVAEANKGPFELAAGQVRVLLALEHCRCLEPFRKRHLVTFQVRVVAARARP